MTGASLNYQSSGEHAKVTFVYLRLKLDGPHNPRRFMRSGIGLWSSANVNLSPLIVEAHHMVIEEIPAEHSFEVPRKLEW
jgi:hypothetical protein